MPNIGSHSVSCNCYTPPSRRLLHKDYIKICNVSTLNRIAIMTSLSLLSVPAIAEDIQGNDDKPTVHLPKIVVTATRLPTLTSNTIAQTRVVDSEDLKRFEGETVLEVINAQPGFSLKSDGGMGQSATFYLRGYDSKRVLVLIDGVRYGSATTGQPALQFLPADQIDRIEILYGASGSSIYGSDAMGGVIQIFSKGTAATQSNVSATVGYGSHNHYLYGATGQWVSNDNDSQNKTVVSLSASHNETDGISAQAYQTGANADDDGFKSDNASLLIRSNLSDTIEVGATGLIAQSTTEFDDYSNVADAYIDQTNGAYSIFGQYAKDKNSIKLSLGQSIDELDNHIGDEFETLQTQATLTSTYSLPKGVLLAGAEWLKQEVTFADGTGSATTISRYSQNERDISSGFLGYQLAAKRYDIQANLRLDDNSQFGNHSTYGIGASYDINDNIRIGGNYATAFRAPTINDLYVQSPYYVPNPDLKLETSQNTELFVEFNTQNQHTRLTGYYNKAEDLINNIPYPGTYKYQAVNIEEARIQGLSFDSEWYINDYLMGVQYSYNKSEDLSAPNSGNQLVFRPKNSGLIYAGYQDYSMNLRAELEYIGKRFNNVANTEELDSYQLLNISGSYNLSPKLTMTTRINNLLNEDYSTNAATGTYGFRYNQDGTNYMTSLNYRW